MATVVRRFKFSAISVFVIEAGDFYFRFFTNRQVVTGTGGVPYELATPYAGDDVRDIKWTQVNDIVYLTHPLYPPQKLTRIQDDDWTIEDVAFREPPFLTENITTTTITPSGTTGSITLLASVDIFDDAHVGAYWRIGHKVAGAYVEHGITANGNSTTLQIYGEYTLRTYGNWGADILIQRSLDSGTTWETVANYHGAIPGADEPGFRNFDAAGTADEVALYRIRIENFDANSESSAIAVLERPEASVYGYAQITAVGSGGSATATVIETLQSATATAIWAEGAWSEYRGYPRACTVHEARLVFGGTDYQPLTLWGSVIDDFENFAAGVDDDDSYAHTIASTGQPQTQWLASREVLIMGTSLGLFRVRGDGFGNIIAPTRVDAKKRDNEQAAYVEAEECGTPIAFAGLKGPGRKIFASVYNESADRFVNEELTILSEQISEGGILEMAWQNDTRRLWCIRGDGALVCLTYDETQQVVGWHEHVTDGNFVSVTTIPGDDDAEDEVWLVVERTIGSETITLIELLDPDFWEVREDYFGVDSGLTYEGSPESHFTGLDHLAGETIEGLADGEPFEAEVDEHGEFDLPSAIGTASVVHAGLPFTATLETFRLDADAALGVHVGRTKKIDGVVARMAKTWGGTYAVGAETFPIEAPPTKEDDDLLGDERPADIPLKGFVQGHTYDPTVKIVQAEPLPLNVLALAIDLNVGES